jgi:hypothetical protein
VDGGTWRRVSGTDSWSWTWSTAATDNGTRTLTVRATDAAGNVGTSSRSVTVSNPTPDTTAPTVAFSSPAVGATVSGTTTVTGSAGDDRGLAKVEVRVGSGSYVSVSGTTSWSWSWSTAGLTNGTHTLTARATDTSGNVSTTSRSFTVSNTTSSPTTAPDTQGSWTSPEGVRINVNSAGPWTIRNIYTMLQENALDLDRVGPSLTINVQDQYSSYAVTSATQSGGSYTGYRATIWLQGVGSTFASGPDDILAHEYGHVWSYYLFYLVHNGSWGQYPSARWTTTDGSSRLSDDPRTGSSYAWTIAEIIADDYRLLLGSDSAVQQRPWHLNTTIPHPRDVRGLEAHLLGAFRGA